jgi:hypothetical protein
MQPAMTRRQFVAAGTGGALKQHRDDLKAHPPQRIEKQVPLGP